jgi:hypothetical protein
MHKINAWDKLNMDHCIAFYIQRYIVHSKMEQQDMLYSENFQSPNQMMTLPNQLLWSIIGTKRTAEHDELYYYTRYCWTWCTILLHKILLNMMYNTATQDTAEHDVQYCYTRYCWTWCTILLHKLLLNARKRHILWSVSAAQLGCANTIFVRK